MLREEIELVRQIVKEEIAAALKIKNPEPVKAEVKTDPFTKKEIGINK